MSRLSARARKIVSFLSRGGGIYPSTMLRMVPLPTLSAWGGRRHSIIVRRNRRRHVAAARPVLGRRGRGRCIFGGRQETALVLVGALELADRLGRPFLERQRAIAVDVELGERLAPRRKQLLFLDLAVLVLV